MAAFADYLLLFSSVLLVTAKAQIPVNISVSHEVERENGTAVLECKLKNFDGNSEVTWSKIEGSEIVLLAKGSSILVVNHVINNLVKYDTALDSRAFMNYTSYLTINHLQTKDSGTYICSIFLTEFPPALWPKANGTLTVQEKDRCQGSNCPQSSNTTISPTSFTIVRSETTTTEFKVRHPASVTNITQTGAVLLVDFRDPIGEASSISYNIKCVDSPDQRLAINIDLVKKDVSWGQGSARFTLVGLSPGQLYRCNATSQTSAGPGWTDRFGFITAEKENSRRVFQWHHAVLPSVGILVVVGAWVVQRHGS